MTRALLSLSLLATTALTTPVAADITPAEVWLDLKSYMESVGYSVSGTERGGGDALTVENVIMQSDLPEDGGTVSLEVGTLTLTDIGDAVSIDFPEVMPIRFDVETEPGQRGAGVVEYRHTGLEMLVSGSANATRYDYSAEALTLEIVDLSVDGTPVGRDAIRMDVTMSGVTGNSLSELGAMRSLDQSFGVDTLEYDLFFSDPENAASVGQVVGNMKNLVMTGSSELPLTMSDEQEANPFALGALADVAVSHGGGAFNLNATEDGAVTAYAQTSQSGGFTFDMTDTSMGYGANAQGVSIQLASADLPVPVSLQAAETAFEFLAPVRPSGMAEDFDLLVALRDFEMADLLWNMFDPGKALPRDPATLEIDLSGKMRTIVDFFDESTITNLGQESMPIELESVSLDALTLDLAGALLTGSGGFTFNNDDLETFDGFPAPNGEINLELTGANRLIDTLVAMGLLPQEQAMGARMMMTMFARPAGDDVLTSTLEVRENGQILANGQRLQ